MTFDESKVNVFSHEEFGNIRTITRNNEVWFVAKDVCDVLEIGNASEALRGLDDDERSTIRITEGGPERNIINESGLYSLILRSRKPEAKRFKKWVTSEVLPTIRKYGVYMTEDRIEEVLFNPDAIIRIATQLKEERELRQKAEEKIAMDAPKVLRSEMVLASDDSIPIGTLANILNQNGIDIGRNRLYEKLRSLGFLIKQPGSRWNHPRQEYLDSGLFELEENTYVDPEGNVRVSYITRVTGEGQTFFIWYFLANMMLDKSLNYRQTRLL